MLMALAAKHRPIRVLFVAEDGTLCRGRTLERPRVGEPTRLLVMRRRRLELVHARESEGRQPGTWHREGKAS